MLGDLLYPHGAALVAREVKLVNATDRRSFALIDCYLLLSPATIPKGFGFNYPIAKGRLRAVEEPLPCVLAHGAARVLRVLLALVLIEHGEDAPCQLPGRVIARLLRDRDDLHPVLGEVALVEAKCNRIPKEP